jgi:hypothetical protein
MVSWICRIIGHKRYERDGFSLIHAGGACLRCDSPPPFPLRKQVSS